MGFYRVLMVFHWGLLCFCLRTSGLKMIFGQRVW